VSNVFDRVLCRAADLPGVMAFGHYGWPVPLLAGIGLHAVPGLAGPVCLLALTPVIAGTVAVAAHAQELVSCQACGPRLIGRHDVVALPGLPRRQARWRAWQLRMVHAPWRSLSFWGLVVTGFALDLWGGALGRVLSGVPMGALFVTMLVTAPAVHARLEAVCPWCRDGGHGGHGRGDHDGPGDDPQPGPGGHGLAVPQVPDCAEDLLASWADTPAAADPVGLVVAGRPSHVVAGPAGPRVPHPRGPQHDQGNRGSSGGAR
jgi:hypothetical protein